jgi:hypothetical protein
MDREGEEKMFEHGKALFLGMLFTTATLLLLTWPGYAQVGYKDYLLGTTKEKILSLLESRGIDYRESTETYDIVDPGNGVYESYPDESMNQSVTQKLFTYMSKGILIVPTPKAGISFEDGAQVDLSFDDNDKVMELYVMYQFGQMKYDAINAILKGKYGASIKTFVDSWGAKWTYYKRPGVTIDVMSTMGDTSGCGQLHYVSDSLKSAWLKRMYTVGKNAQQQQTQQQIDTESSKY